MSKSRGGVCDTRCQQFHREVSKKVDRIKTQWFIKNRQRLYENLKEERFTDKLKSLQQKKKKSNEQHHQKRDVENVEQRILPLWRSTDKDVGQMRAMKPEIENIIYSAKDASFTSRKKYFRERYKSKPEDRFYYPYCSSWTYGWRLQDYPETRPPKYGVKSIMKTTFYRKNASSLQRDPYWYGMCQTSNPKNFDELLSY